MGSIALVDFELRVIQLLDRALHAVRKHLRDNT